MIDNRTYKLLKTLYRRGKLTLNEVGELTKYDERKRPSPSISALTKSHFIATWNGDKTINDLGDKEWLGFQITIDGRAYIEQEQRTRLNFWLPYAITTGIAVLSLITSILSLVFSCNQGS